MDALELKLSLIEQLKTIDDVKLLTQIKNLISIATEKKETRYPAQMTLDELKEVLKKSRYQYRGFDICGDRDKARARSHGGRFCRCIRYSLYQTRAADPPARCLFRCL